MVFYYSIMFMYIFFFILILFSKEYSLEELKNEVRDKTQIYGDKIAKPINEDKNNKDHKPTTEELIEAEIIKNNSFINKTVIIKDVIFIQKKDVKLVFRNYQGMILEAKIPEKSNISLKHGTKYKVKGDLLSVSDLTQIKFIEATPIH